MVASVGPLYAAQDQEKAYIEWKPVEGALSYSVEVTDSFGDLVYEKTTADVKLAMSLPYGKYKYRVGVFTKFKKTNWSEWYTLMIVPALEPEIHSVTPATLFSEVKNKIIIKGKNFYRSSKVTVKTSDKTLTVKNVKLIDSETLSVKVDTKGARIDTYDLEVTNPGDLLDVRAVKKNQFSVVEKPPGYPIEYQLGMNVGYYSSSLGMKDAYSGSVGFQFFCEFRSLGKSHEALSFLNKAPGLYPGVLFSFFGFVGPKPGFGTSLMIQAGLYLGYEFSFPLTGDLQWHISPVIGYKQYFRSHLFERSDYMGTKPIMLIGCNARFDLPKKFFIGIALDYNVVFEIKPVHLLGVFIRCGYRL